MPLRMNQNIYSNLGYDLENLANLYHSKTLSIYLFSLKKKSFKMRRSYYFVIVMKAVAEIAFIHLAYQLLNLDLPLSGYLLKGFKGSTIVDIAGRIIS